ncbi:mannose-1-phosphate guanylyltransferase/mannose-6-phosphate isomerase [Rhodocista pekingensis]|uniref:mannose-1-phosphate guanylyltransferase n=1 Tax=Rhodocista pekingensis TaxID=201185 RepID=A0ABW2KYR2_9PROT
MPNSIDSAVAEVMDGMSNVGRKQIQPVLLSGGTGSRLWPMSRERFPKQLLALSGKRTMIQETALRVGDARGFRSPIVVCNQEHRFSVGEQLQAVGIEPAAIVLEPVGRNTAAAAAIAARLAAHDDPDALLLLLPADHVVQDRAAFGRAVEQAARAAAAGFLVTFGVRPTSPETGYGYIKAGAALDGIAGVQRVARFTEKPSLAVAEAFVAGGEHLWNSGMFLFRAGTFLEELERHAPAVLAATDAALAAATRDLDFLRLDPEAFGRSPNLSIDYAVMEKTDRAAVVPADLGWTDVGSWSALWEIGEKDADGNVVQGDVMLVDAHDNYIRSDGMLTAVLGIDDAVLVVTGDAILLARRDRVQDVKGIVERLKQSGRTEPLEHRKVHRPWGSYESITSGERFQVKCLTVKPGRKLSLQKHFHRAEHWVVVNGTALVTRDGEEMLVRENESVYLPLGCVHRLENPGKVPLNLIEVQSGAYLGEDDIVRFEDTYGRV